jgi:hypothetical protein
VLLALTCAFAATAEAQSDPTKAKAQPPAGPSDKMLEAMKSKIPTSPRIPTAFTELFDERDARAMDALNYLRCLSVTLRAIKVGALGLVPREWVITCVEQKNEWRGVFVDLSSEDGTARVRKQFALRDNGKVVTDPVDTAKAAGIARALVRGTTAPTPGAGKHEFLPVPLPQKTFIEVWFLPVPQDPSRATVGGDSLIQMNADGTRELGHSRTTAPIRTIAVSPGESYALKSLEERIPLISELMLAHMALSIAPEVRVRTNQYESIFTRGDAPVKHVQR